jgi:hypothetical protein
MNDDDDQCDLHQLGACNCVARPSGLAETLDELSFQRSACSAAQLGQVDKLARILQRNPSAVHSDGSAGTSGYTPLHYAARAGHVPALELLLKHGVGRGAGAAPYGLSRRLHAGRAAGPCSAGPPTSLRALCPCAGADVNAATAQGRATSLHRAAFAGRAAAVRALLQHNADPLLQDADGESALHKAAGQVRLPRCRPAARARGLQHVRCSPFGRRTGLYGCCCCGGCCCCCCCGGGGGGSRHSRRIKWRRRR